MQTVFVLDDLEVEIAPAGLEPNSVNVVIIPRFIGHLI